MQNPPTLDLGIHSSPRSAIPPSKAISQSEIVDKAPLHTSPFTPTHTLPLPLRPPIPRSSPFHLHVNDAPALMNLNWIPTHLTKLVPGNSPRCESFRRLLPARTTPPGFPNRIYMCRAGQFSPLNTSTSTHTHCEVLYASVWCAKIRFALGPSSSVAF